MRVEGWIDEDNLPAFVELVALFLGGVWDDGDQAAVDHGLHGTDAEADRWFEYPIVARDDGRPAAVIAFAQAVGDSVLFTRVDVDDPTDHLIGRLAALRDICASYSVTRRRL